MKYNKRTRHLAALLFMDRVACQLHKRISCNDSREESAEYKAWAIAYKALRQIARELGAANYYDIRWGVFDDIV